MDDAILAQLVTMNGRIGELRAHVDRIPVIEKKLDRIKDTFRREIDVHARECKARPSMAPLRLSKRWMRWIVYIGVLIGSAVAGGGLVYARVYLDDVASATHARQ